VEEGLLRVQKDAWFYRGEDFPAAKIGLRSAAGEQYTIVEEDTGDIIGTEGVAELRGNRPVIKGANKWRFTGDTNQPYVQEHIDLLASIAGEGPHLNEGKRIAESTLTAIMGRMSAYTGKEITWDEALSSELDLSPTSYEFGDLPMRPVAVPGRTPMV
jgi:hypothetical protein